MKEQEIVAVVGGAAGLTDEDHATAATHATLTVLGQRLAANESGDLPPGIAEALPATDEPARGDGAAFGVEDFYRRVAEEEGRGCTPDGAREHARAVIAALKSGVGDDEFADLVSQLPHDYRTDVLSTASADDR